MQLEPLLEKGYIIDCDYVIRVKDYHRLTPLISVEVELWDEL